MFRLSMMETFEILHEGNGRRLGKYRADLGGKRVSEVLKALEKDRLDGNLVDDDTVVLTDSDLVRAGRKSIHVLAIDTRSLSRSVNFD